VKHLTGNDRLQARGPYERRPTEFQPTHTLYLITNDKPQIRSDDFAVWQRVKPVPMLTSFVDHPEGSYQRKAIKNMKDILLKEAIGILAWMIKGAQQYLTDGLTTPPVVLNEATEYRRGESLILAWADERCIVMPSVGQLAKELFASFNEYLVSNGFKSWTNKTFIVKLEKELADRGVRKREKYTNQGAFFDGIGLRGEAR
jgi:putative DNA primase/helicase